MPETLLDFVRGMLPAISRTFESRLEEPVYAVRRGLEASAACVVCALATHATDHQAFRHLQESGGGVRRAGERGLPEDHLEEASRTLAATRLLDRLFRADRSSLVSLIAHASGVRASSAGSLLLEATRLVARHYYPPGWHVGTDLDPLGDRLRLEARDFAELLPPGASLIPSLASFARPLETRPAKRVARSASSKWLWLIPLFLALVLGILVMIFSRKGDFPEADPVQGSAQSTTAALESVGISLTKIETASPLGEFSDHTAPMNAKLPFPSGKEVARFITILNRPSQPEGGTSATGNGTIAAASSPEEAAGEIRLRVIETKLSAQQAETHTGPRQTKSVQK